ncbi:MAG: hypothetical protein WBF53_06695 [Litorimonas sp.]
MGWICLHKTYGFNAKQYVIDNFTTAGQSVVGSAKGQGGYYLAVRVAEPSEALLQTYLPEPDRSVVVGVVCLCNSKNGEFCYKDMGETSGPNHWGCPDRILGRLSKLRPSIRPSFQWATVWREKCRRRNHHHALVQRLEMDDVVSFSRDLSFGGIVIREGTPITVGRKQRRTQTFIVPGIGPARIRSWKDDVVLPKHLAKHAMPDAETLDVEEDLRIWHGEEDTDKARLRQAIEGAVRASVNSDLVGVYQHETASVGTLESALVIWFDGTSFGVHRVSFRPEEGWSLHNGEYGLSYCNALQAVFCRS